MRRPPRTRVDGYVRVSRVGRRRGERFVSPDLQRAQIESWAASRRVVLLSVFEELEESGTRLDRPLLQAALSRIETGRSQGLVVSRVNRFGRSLIDGLVQVERVRSAGGEFYSVQDGLDTSTPSGRLVLRIMLSMAEWELDRIRDDWEAAMASALERGVYVHGSVPPGYVKRRSGRLRVNPRTAPVIAEAFRRRAAGDSLAGIGRYIESEGVLTGRGNPGWMRKGVGDVLRNRIYLGEMKYGDFHRDHAHPAIIDAATFAAAQNPRQLGPRRGGDPSALLTGLVRCASCGMKVGTVRHFKKDGRVLRSYLCRRHYSAGRCPGAAMIYVSTLDAFVIDGFYLLLGRRRHAPRRALAAAEVKAAEREADLPRYRDNERLLRALGEDAFAAGIETRVRRLHAARLELADARARVVSHELPAVPELRAQWPDLDVPQQRALISQVIDCIYVASGRGFVEHRVTICPLGTAPIPRWRGQGPGDTILPLQPRRRWLNPTPGPTGRRKLKTRAVEPQRPCVGDE